MESSNQNIIRAKAWLPSSAMSKYDEEITLVYKDVHECARGEFGTVFRAINCENDEMFAFKQVYYSKSKGSKSKGIMNTELEILRGLDHQNVVKLKFYFRYTTVKSFDRLYIGLEYMPQTLWTQRCGRQNTERPFEPLEVKVYAYQLFRAISYLHSRKIAHMDINCHNILVDPSTNVLKLCDFGSAKKFYTPYPSLQGIGVSDRIGLSNPVKPSRVEIDVSSTGWVLAVCLSWKTPSNIDSSLWKVIIPAILDRKSLPVRQRKIPTGSATTSNGSDSRNIEAKVFDKATSQEIKFLSAVFLGDAFTEKVSTIRYLTLDYFKELHQPDLCFANGERLPPLFNFTKEELEIEPGIAKNNIIPIWSEIAANVNQEERES